MREKKHGKKRFAKIIVGESQENMFKLKTGNRKTFSRQNIEKFA